MIVKKILYSYVFWINWIFEFVKKGEVKYVFIEKFNVFKDVKIEEINLIF